MWMLTAQGIERMMMGLIHFGGGFPCARQLEGHPADDEVQDQIATEGHHVPEHHGVQASGGGRR